MVKPIQVTVSDSDGCSNSFGGTDGWVPAAIKQFYQLYENQLAHAFSTSCNFSLRPPTEGP